MKIAITAESTIDLPKSLLEELNVRTLPYTVVLGDKEFKDGDFSTTEIFEFVAKNNILPKTTAINTEEYTEFFTEMKKDYDAIIHFSLSSHLTSSTSHAIAAAAEMENVYVIDSLSLSTGIAIQLLYACELVKKLDDPKEIVRRIEARKPFVQASFVLERLDYLYKGGRCNSLQFLGANLLHLRPRIVVKDGKMSSDKKYRGKIEHAVSKYCQECVQEFNNIDKSFAFVTYTSATPEMIAAARKVLEDAGVERIYETTAGATITSHCGEHTLGILYYNDGGAE